jgi:hypothetical protein
MRKFGLSKPSEDQIQLHQTMKIEKQKSSSEQELELRIKKLEDDCKCLNSVDRFSTYFCLRFLLKFKKYDNDNATIVDYGK